MVIANAAKCSVEQITTAFAAHFGIKPQDLRGRHNAKLVRRVRAVTVWFSWKCSTASIGAISEYYGNRPVQEIDSLLCDGKKLFLAGKFATEIEGLCRKLKIRIYR